MKKKTSLPVLPAPGEQMLQMISGYWLSQMLFVAAELGVADLLAKKPATAADLARRVRVNGPMLHRVLRGLAGAGVFSLGHDSRFSLTLLGETLRSDTPDSIRDFCRMMVAGYNWSAWQGLLEGVRTGKVPFDRAHGMAVFPYFQEHPKDERLFAASMASISRTENQAIARAFDFGRFSTLMDVGGSQGHLLAEILTRFPKLQGVLFDQPQVVRAARKAGYISAKAVAARCQTKGGSFFDEVPAGADAYMMKYILHDWDDRRSLQILRKLRAAMRPKDRLLIVEHVVRDDNQPEMGKMLDINMLVVTGGLERTAEQFKTLLRKGGFALRQIHPTESRLSIVEAVRS